MKGLYPCIALRCSPAPCSRRKLRAYVKVLALVQLTQPTVFSVPKVLQMGDVITLELVREVPAKMLPPGSVCVQELPPGPAGITAENAQNILAER